MTEKKTTKAKTQTEEESEKVDALETMRLFDLQGGTTGSSSQNKDVADDEMRNSSGG